MMHKNTVDHTGRKYGMLTGLRPGPKKGDAYTWWWECECGKVKNIATGNVVGGTTKSCGCYWRKSIALSNTTHGHSTCKITANSAGGSSEYRSWNSMKTRCLNTWDKDYPRYGGKGITICRRWRNSFQHFLEDMGLKPDSRHTIDRIDGKGNYSCGHCVECIGMEWSANCRWADIYTQASNKTTNRFITANGMTMTIAQWARKIGCSRQALRYRIEHGCDPVRAVTLNFNHANRL